MAQIIKSAIDQVTRLLIIVSIAAVFSNSLYAYELEGERSLLVDVIAAHRANWDALSTWSGKVTILDIRVRTGSTQIHQELSECDFYYQAEPRMLRWNWRVVTPGNRESPPINPIVNGIVTQEELALLQISNITRDGQHERIKSVRILRPKKYEVGLSNQAFDPIYYTRYRGKDLAKRFDWFRRGADRLPVDGNRVFKEGDLVVLEHDTPEVLNRYTVNLSKGGSLVRYEAEERRESVPISASMWTWIYEEKNEGLWLPKEMSYWREYFDTTAGQNKNEAREENRFIPYYSSRRRIVRWISSQVNQPLGEEVFALKNLGLEEGDVISNTITRDTYRYGEREDISKSE